MDRVIVVPTVPHSGTHFMRDHLLAGLDTYVRHPYDEELPKLEELIDAGNPVIVPVRLFGRLEESWRRHGKDPENFAGLSLLEWKERVHGLCDRAGSLGFLLNIEIPGLRRLQLDDINFDLGLELETDWPIIRQAA